MQDLSPQPGDLDPIETASRDELAALQLQRLQWTLHHAYDNVAFYRASFDRHGVHPDDCTSLEDLAKFPFTAKNDLRDNYPFGMFAVPREEVVREQLTSLVDDYCDGAAAPLMLALVPNVPSSS